jgi:hypothetical protein
MIARPAQPANLEDMMAKQANDTNVRRDEDGPDYDGAINLIRGQIRTNQSDINGLAQDQGTLFGRIDKQMGVNSKAAKAFAAIDIMAEEKRTDYLRSLLGLLGRAGYDKFNDLVDHMHRADGSAPAGKPDKADKAPVTPPGATDTDISLDPDEVEEQRKREADPMFKEGQSATVHRLPAGQKVN